MSQHSETIQIFFLIFSGLLMLCLFLFKYLHDHPRIHSILSEPAMTLLVGMSVSFVVSIFFVFKEERNDNFNGNVESEVEQDLANSILSFQTRVFFLALLPPILFNSGYQLQRELFYRHFAPISLFACVGTCISGFCTGGLLVAMRHFGLFGGYFYPTVMELFTFGALIAATDTVSVVGILQAKQVDPHLFSLVFGESALNDAVAIVLFKSLSTFLIQDAFGDSSTLLAATVRFVAHLSVQAICSPLLGMLYAFCLALAFKKVDLRREHKMLELALYIMPMYIPYMLAEALELSGMIAIFFTGMFAKRYMEPNVSDSTKQHAEMLFKLFAFLAETCIFLELGLSVFGLSGQFQWPFIGCALLTALVGRATSIYPLAACYNLSLTKVVLVTAATCGSTVNCADDTSISTLDSSSIQGSLGSMSTSTMKSSAAEASSSSYYSSGGGGSSSWSNTTTTRRETPKKRLDKRIPLSFMHMLTFAGLRGAVAYACARDFPNLYGHRDTFVAATMVIVLFTIVVMGGGTEPLMERLKIRTNVDEKAYMRNWRLQRKLKGRFHRFEYHYIYRMVVRAPNSNNSCNNILEEERDASRIIKHCMTPITRNTATTSTTGKLGFQHDNDDADDDDDEIYDYYSGGAMMEDESSPHFTSSGPSHDHTPHHHSFLDYSMYRPPDVDTYDDGQMLAAALVGPAAAATTSTTPMTMMNDDSDVFNTFRGDESMNHHLYQRGHTISYLGSNSNTSRDAVSSHSEKALDHNHDDADANANANDDQSSLGSESMQSPSQQQQQQQQQQVVEESNSIV